MAKKENNYYFDTFTKGLSFASDAAVLLKKCLENYDAEKLEAQMDEMHEIEHNADMLKHEMMARLVKEFLPPIEREDIVEFSHTVDDVTDCVEDVLRRMYMFNITALRPDAIDFASVIERGCKALQNMAKELPNFKKSETLKSSIVEINHLEEEGDRLYIAALRKLYTDEKDPVAIASWTALYDTLEEQLIKSGRQVPTAFFIGYF